jgi:hypothetical protein
MKTQLLIFVLLGIIVANIKSQEYQTVYSDRIVSFGNDSREVRSLRIDSVHYEMDSVFYTNSNIQQLDYNCFNARGASWIGEKIIVQDNGYNLYFNHALDTIKINTNAQLNQSWKAYELTDSLLITASITDHNTIEFLGQVDSVKTITFKVFDKLNTPIAHELNNISILLSKNYGWIKTLEFYHFPEIKVRTLIGSSKPALGIVNLTWLDVHDYQVGDEIHVLSETTTSIDINNVLRNSHSTIYNYLKRENYADSVVYEIDVMESRVKHWLVTDSIVSSFTRDTIIQVYTPDSIFDKLPGEPIINVSESGQEASTYVMYYSNRSEKLPPIHYLEFQSDSCWMFPIYDGCFFSSLRYIQGLGGPYSQCESLLGFSKRELIYYKKGDETWGTPLLITGIPQNNPTTQVNIYPNPSQGFLSITHNFSEPLIIELIDISGKILMTERLTASQLVLNISHLDKGIYLYRLRSNQTVLEKGKLIKN